MIRNVDGVKGTSARAADLPVPVTAFVGRDREVRELLEMLSRPSCRLVTLLGPGGTGKTRLAIEAARVWREAMGTDVAFVPLEAVSGPEGVAAEIASVVGVRGAGESRPREQLARVLADRELLLVLDNFEHVLEAAELVSELLQALAGLRVLVTSREALNLSSEWRYTVHGLPVPPASEDGDAGRFAAAQLFAERAQRVDPGFSLEREAREVARICRMVDGIPLAIEIAASWTSSLSCAEIAEEITKRIDFLATNRRDVPERHRSVQAVFDESWQRLGESERWAFARLSVFRGGFDREAALAVAGREEAGLGLLTSLVDRSLIWKDEGGRFHMHELLSQCAKDRLRESPGALEDALERHCDYYLSLACRLLQDMLSHAQIEANRALAADYDNVLAAVDRALEGARIDGLMEAVQAVVIFYQFSGRYGEGVRLTERVARALDSWEPSAEVRRALAQVYVDLGWLYVRVGRLPDAVKVAERAADLHGDLGGVLPPGSSTDPKLVLAFVGLVEGDYERAERLSRESLERAQSEEHRENVPYAHFGIAEAAYRQGRYEEALEHGSVAMERTREIGDRWFEAYVLNQLGMTLSALGDSGAAREQFERSYAIRQEFGDPEGMAVALNHLGELALAEGDYRLALRRFEESVRLYRDLDDIGGRATALRGARRSRTRGWGGPGRRQPTCEGRSGTRRA